jgi:hypothetical protein
MQAKDYNSKKINDVSQDENDNNSNKEVEEVEPNKFLAPPKQAANVMMKILPTRHKNKLQNLVLRGHSFKSLQDSRYSNFFIGHCQAQRSKKKVLHIPLD